MQYRTEIDGLRALAVLPVIFFHAGFSFFSGGYVGVDVFFVISGYLITGIIIDDLAKERFSFIQFYERRARRLLPALFLVLLVSTPLALALMTPPELKDYGFALLSVSLFASNIYFWRESGYFSSETELNPLLHTWSLAVEEQFYLLYPIVLILCWRTVGHAWTSILMFLALLVSLGLAHWGAYFYPDATFYLLPTRIWELTIGGLAAIFMAKTKDNHGVHPNNLLSIVGFLLIISSVAFFDSRTPFPSLYALAPTIGTLLIILFANGDTLVGRLLSLKPLVVLGLTSYSAYLWHQPILAFARRATGEELRPLMAISLCLLSLALAYASWHWVENYFRKKDLVSRKNIFLLSGFGLILTLFIGGLTATTSGFLGWQDEKDQALFREFYDPEAYVPARFSDHTLAQFDDSKRRVLIIGDSFAEDLVNALYESGIAKDLSLSTYKIPFRCGNLNINQVKLHEYQAKDCIKFDGYKNADLQNLIVSADELWLQSDWQAWQVPLLEESISNLSARSTGKIIVFGTKSFGPIRISDPAVRRDPQTLLESRMISAQVTEIAETMRSTVPKYAQYIDTLKIICGSYTHCSNATPDERLRSFDGRHLTAHGAREYGLLLKDHLETTR
ncbi:MAG: acyltransferase [Pseudomonadales bacterium]|nr:acyltransferase [Pseudomonadales bacterium]